MTSSKRNMSLLWTLRGRRKSRAEKVTRDPRWGQAPRPLGPRLSPSPPVWPPMRCAPKLEGRTSRPRRILNGLRRWLLSKDMGRKHHLPQATSPAPLSWRSSTRGGWMPVGPWWKKQPRTFKLPLTLHLFLHRRARPRRHRSPNPLSYQGLLHPVQAQHSKTRGRLLKSSRRRSPRTSLVPERVREPLLLHQPPVLL